MKFLAVFFVGAMDFPDNSVINSVLLNPMHKRQKFCGKAELSVVSSEVVINYGAIKHDVLSAFDYVFVGFSLFGDVILF